MATSIFDFFSKIVSKAPIFIIIAVILLFMAGLELSQQVKLDQGYKTYFSKEHKEFRQSELYFKDFGTSIASAYIFVKGDDVVNYDTFEYMLELEDSLSNIDGIGETKSAARSVVNAYGYLPQDENVLRDFVNKYASFLVPKSSFALIELEVTTTSESDYDQIAKEIERKLDIIPKPAGVVVEATGNPVVRYQTNQAIGGSMAMMGMAAVTLMVMILVIVFRGVVARKRFLMLPLVISIFTTVMVYGLMPIIGIPLTDVTNAFFPVLIGLSIEYAAQFQGRFEEEMRKGLTSIKAATNSIKSVGVALSLAMITTVIGFLSMVFSGVPALSWFGFLSAIGLVIAFLLSLTFLPAILIVMEKGKREEAEKAGERDLMAGFLETLSLIPTKNPKTVLVVTLLLVTVGYYGYANVGLLTDFNKYVPQDLPAIQKMDELENLVGSSDRMIAVVETDELNGEYLSKIETLSEYIVATEPQITAYDNLNRVILRYNGEIPANDVELLYVLDNIPSEQTRRYLSGNTIAIYFTVSSMDWLEFRNLYNRVNDAINFFGLEEGYYLTGDVVLKMFVADLIVNGQAKMTMASFALVTILLLFVYRSFRNAIVPLLPITTTIVLVGAFMYLTGMNRTLISASLNSLTVGLGIDFSIHVMERYFEERKLGRSPEESVDITVKNIGKAIMTSGLTMAGGFGAMMVSPFPIMREFGLVSVVAILLSLLAALTVVPAFLIVTERFKERKNSASASASDSV